MRFVPYLGGIKEWELVSKSGFCTWNNKLSLPGFIHLMYIMIDDDLRILEGHTFFI